MVRIKQTISSQSIIYDDKYYKWSNIFFVTKQYALLNRSWLFYFVYVYYHNFIIVLSLVQVRFQLNDSTLYEGTMD